MGLNVVFELLFGGSEVTHIMSSVTRILPVTTDDNQAKLIKFKGPKYFSMDNTDSDLPKQLYVRKDIYGDIPPGIKEGKVVEEEIPGYGNYVRINYNYSKFKQFTDSIKNLFDGERKPVPGEANYTYMRGLERIN